MNILGFCHFVVRSYWNRNGRHIDWESRNVIASLACSTLWKPTFIAVIAVLFASGPLVGNQQASAYYYGGYGYHHFYYRRFYYHHIHPYYHHFYYRFQDHMKISGINSDHRIEGVRKHVFVIQHDIGENWSLFTKELLLLLRRSVTILFTCNSY